MGGRASMKECEAENTSRVTAEEGTAQQNDILRVVLSYVNDKSPPDNVSLSFRDDRPTDGGETASGGWKVWEAASFLQIVDTHASFATCPPLCKERECLCTILAAASANNFVNGVDGITPTLIDVLRVLVCISEGDSCQRASYE